MKNNYRKMKQVDLLTNIYADKNFRNDYFKWTRIGGYKNNKSETNAVVVAYEYYMIDKLNQSWLSRLQYSDIDLVNFKGHAKHIKQFLSTYNPQ